MLPVPRQSTSLLGNNQAAVIFPVLFWGNAIDFPEIPQERGVIRKAGGLPALSNVLPLRHDLTGSNDPLVHNKIIHLLRKALKKAGLDYIPVISLNFRRK